jgi:predicted dehydrogenase
MRFGLIGYGSIGRRHVQNLLLLGKEDIILLRKKGNGNEHGLQEVNSLDALLSTEPDAVVLANPTSMHYEYFSALLPLNMNLLAEKPLVSETEDLGALRALLHEYKGYGMGAFNMRFHPTVVKAQEWLKEGRLGHIHSARFHVGQYLPDWRPDQDYRRSYSANSEMGGGVILDLIHEIDLATCLVGFPAEPLSSRVNRSSNLEINTEDLAEILYITKSESIVSIHLDYLTHGYRRYFELIGSEAHLCADLFGNKIKLTERGGNIEEFGFQEFERNHMYRDMMKSFVEGASDGFPNPISLTEVLDLNEMALALRDGESYGV